VETGAHPSSVDRRIKKKILWSKEEVNESQLRHVGVLLTDNTVRAHSSAQALIAAFTPGDRLR